MKDRVKRTWKRLLSLIFCLILTVQMMPGAANAVLSGVYFVAVDYDLMPLSQETMPFWSNGQLYVSYTAFSGSYGSILGISCSINNARQVTVLFTLQNALFFDTGAGSTYDNQGNTYTETAIEKNGHIFFPLQLVTSFFGLTYSYRQTETVPLIRIKNRSAVLSDKDFIEAASSLMRSRYREYEESLTATVTPPTTSTDPDEPAPTVYEGQRVYLVFRVTSRDSTLSILSSLSRYGKQGTFIMTPQQMAEDHDLLRQLVGGGHAIAIAPSGSESMVEQLEQANRTLQTATHTRTRLVWLEKGQSGSAAESAGYCPVSCAMDYSRQSMTSSYRAENLYDHLSQLSLRDQTVFLGDDSNNTAALDRLLSRLQSIKCRVIAYRETL